MGYTQTLPIKLTPEQRLALAAIEKARGISASALGREAIVAAYDLDRLAEQMLAAGAELVGQGGRGQTE